MIWRPIDALARWLGDHMGAQNQLRLGIVLVILSLPLYVYGPFSGEPLAIFWMSALALVGEHFGTDDDADAGQRQEDEE